MPVPDGRSAIRLARQRTGYLARSAERIGAITAPDGFRYFNPIGQDTMIHFDTVRTYDEIKRELQIARKYLDRRDWTAAHRYIMSAMGMGGSVNDFHNVVAPTPDELAHLKAARASR